MLDSGSFGDIFKVPSIEGTEMYAAKQISYRGKIQNNAAIVSEVYCLAVLDDVNVIKMYEMYITDGEIYIVLEYAENGNMERYLSAATQPSFPDLHGIYSQVLSGIGHCHSMDIAHRDISPANILLTKDNVVKITDFGLAVRCTDNTGSAILCSDYLGNVAYMSPEVLSQTPFLPKPGDIWSLGMLLCFVLYKDVPYKGLELNVILAQQSEAWKHFIQSTRLPYGEIPTSDLCAFLNSLLHLKPTLRPNIGVLISQWHSMFQKSE